MKVFQVIKLLGLGLSASVLVACSSTGQDEARVGSAGNVASNQAGGGAYASGLGYDAQFPGANAGKIDSQTGEKGNTVYFSYDQSSVGPKYQAIIEANAQYLKSHPGAKVRLEGHTDPRGSREYNIGLGQRRGHSVDYQLELLGVNTEQMAVVSYGKEKLAVTGDSPEDYRLDRRVEIVYEDAG